MPSPKKLTVSDQFTLAGIENVASLIIELQDKLIDLKGNRDDLIRAAADSGIPQTQIARAADLSIEQIRNVRAFRYTRDSRRPKQRNPGPTRD